MLTGYTQFYPSLRPTQSVAPQFRGKPAKSFELLYGPYADLMIDYSKGIPSGMMDMIEGKRPSICLIRIEYLHMKRSTEKAYRQLLENGYPVELVLRPKRINAIIQGSIWAKQFDALEQRLDQAYTHVAKIHEGAQSTDPVLKNLMARRAEPGETVKLLVLTDDSDRHAEELTKRIAQKAVPYVLVTGSAKTPIHLWPVRFFRNREQSTFVPPTLLTLTREKSRDYFIMNTPSGRELRRLDLRPDIQGNYSEYVQDISAVRKKVSDIFVSRMRNAVRYPETSYADYKYHEQLQQSKWDGVFWNVGLSPSSGLGKDIGKNIEGFGKFLAQMTGLDVFLPNLERLQSLEAEFKKRFPGLARTSLEYQFMVQEADGSEASHQLAVSVRKQRNSMDTAAQYWAKQLDQFSTFQLKGGRTDIRFSMREPGMLNRRCFLASTFQINALPGEVFTSPVEDSVNGNVYFGQPFYFRGRTFSGLELEIKEGKVINLSLDGAERSAAIGKQEEQLKRWIIEGYDPDQTIPGFNRVGEFAIGFNQQLNKALKGIPVKDPLLAEKQGIHFALGYSYQEAGGKNKSAEHLDLSLGNDEQITVFGDGLEIYKGGKFTEAFLHYPFSYDFGVFQRFRNHGGHYREMPVAGENTSVCRFFKKPNGVIV